MSLGGLVGGHGADHDEHSHRDAEDDSHDVDQVLVLHAPQFDVSARASSGRALARSRNAIMCGPKWSAPSARQEPQQ